MKIILLEDVKSLGKKGDIVKVNDGYARNSLIPGRKGVEATAGNLNTLKQQNKRREKLEEEEYEAAVGLKKKIDGSTVTIKIKAGENGKVFGSVSAKEIAEAAEKQLGISIDKKKIQTDGPIKEIGETEVSVKLHPRVTGTLKVNVAAES